MKQIAIGENHLYSKVYARGGKFVGRRVVVYVLGDFKAQKLRRANPQKRKVNRLGITVTKKLGGAVTRSRVKRILREAYRLTEKETRLKHGFLVVIVARDSAVSAKTQDIRADLTAAFKKLSMFTDADAAADGQTLK